MFSRPSVNTPVLHAITAALALSAEQGAQMCGVSRRQLLYWIERGILGRQRSARLGIADIEKVTLIKRGLEAGLLLRQAVEQVERALVDRVAPADEAGHETPQGSIGACVGQLDEVEKLVEHLQAIIQTERSAQALVDLGDELAAVWSAIDTDESLDSGQMFRQLGRTKLVMRRLVDLRRITGNKVEAD